MHILEYHKMMKKVKSVFDDLMSVEGKFLEDDICLSKESSITWKRSRYIPR